MPDTKIGWNQINNPAPLYYRRFVNATNLCFLPVYVAFINIIPMSDPKRTIFSQIGVAVPFVLQGVGMVLGNGQSYSPPNEIIDSENKK